MMANRKTHPVLKMLNNSLIDLPAPLNISFWWNMGSLLGIFFLIQFVTGLLLACHYSSSSNFAFLSIIHISREVNSGFILHSIHMNGASFFFLFLYLHMARGMYYSSFFHKETWNLGILIYITSMATAFMGYVLPWGQMSFWGATVITSIFSAIPLIGSMTVEWIWGGYAVSAPMLTRFFTIHYFLPFIIAILVAGHLLFLHHKGSSNPLGLKIDTMRVSFHPYFTYKDMLGFSITMTLFFILVFCFPMLLNDPENFLEANPMVTPTHIQPEWYFLWLYAILRSIPNKLGGVIALFLALLLLFSPTLTSPNHSTNGFDMYYKMMFWMWVMACFILSWVGSQPVEFPFIQLGQYATLMYFIYFPLLSFLPYDNTL